MASKKTTRRALITSVLSLLLCISMLVGTTFAWFTDSVTSGRNTIQSGNLDVELYYATTAADVAADNWTKVSANTNVFNYTLWEPGYTQVAYFKVANEGSLALKYTLTADVYDEDIGKTKTGADIQLSKYLKYGVTEDVDALNNRASAAAVATEDFESFELKGASLEAGQSAVVGMVITMPTTVGNEANHNGINIPSIEFGINLMATQEMKETDSFGADYDKDIPLSGLNPVIKDANISSYPFEVRDENGSKIASGEIPAEAVDPAATSTGIIAKKTAINPNLTISAGLEAITYEVTPVGIKEGNNIPLKVNLRIPAGLDPATVKLYHYESEVTYPYTYNPTTGYVSFETADFSPFTPVFDAESEYVPPVADETDIPKAIVKYSSEYVNTEIEWGQYGQWSPTEGLDSKLEAAFTFKCPEESDEAYDYWYCDFYVSLDKALGENEIFLGGNYGDFGWVGFHNGDVTLEANEEIPLLGSVTNNPWTYADVESFVGEFTCGVGDVGNALDGATFTVKLRLTNPDDETECYDVNVVTHTFGGNSKIDDTTVVTTG